jgi:hypothetical protein
MVSTDTGTVGIVTVAIDTASTTTDPAADRDLPSMAFFDLRMRISLPTRLSTALAVLS